MAAALFFAASVIGGVQPSSIGTAAHPSDNAAPGSSAADGSPGDSGIQSRSASPASGGSAKKVPTGDRRSLAPCSPGPPYTSLPCLPVQR